MFLTDEDVNLIINHKTGRIPVDAVYKVMKQFFMEKYEIELLDYLCSPEKIKPVDKKRVSFIVWDISSDYKYRWDFVDSDMEPAVKNAFSEACRKYGLDPDFYDTGNYFMFMTDFCTDALSRLIDKNEQKIEAVLRSYPQIVMQRPGQGVWYIFFDTEADRDKYSKNGLLDEIRRRVRKVTGTLEGFEDKPNDILWTSSMEVFNGKYHGSWRAFLD